MNSVNTKEDLEAAEEEIFQDDFKGKIVEAVSVRAEGVISLVLGELRKSGQLAPLNLPKNAKYFVQVDETDAEKLLTFAFYTDPEDPDQTPE